MLTPRQNFIETIKGGNPDRFVKQFEYMKMVKDPFSVNNPKPARGEENVKDVWGVTQSWRADQPGRLPVHAPGITVCPDIENWRDYVTAPPLDFTEEQWAPFVEAAAKINRDEYFCVAQFTPGVFERMHYLAGFEDVLCAFFECPDETQELIDYIVDWEIELAKGIIDHIHPDLIFHHDDWGTNISTFLPPKMFEEFFVEPYKRLYGFWKENGVEYIVHHSDTYGATIVPAMIEMGIDVWQGCVTGNDIPALIEQYGPQISFMGGVNSLDVDRPDWTYENSFARVKEICEACGKKYFIPCNTMGGPGDANPGVYDATNQAIDEMTKLMF